jgi:hypothetical protein
MLGEELNSSYVTEHGLTGDRAYAVVDQKTGKVASAKNPRKWGSSVFIDPPQLVENIPPVRITFPDGTHVLSDHEGIDYTLSKLLQSIVLENFTHIFYSLYISSYLINTSGKRKPILIILR